MKKEKNYVSKSSYNTGLPVYNPHAAGIALRMAASNLSKRKSPLGDYSRKLKSRIEKKGAVVASAHKLSKIIYTMIKNQHEYSEQTIIKHQKAYNDNKIKNLERRLA